MTILQLFSNLAEYHNLEYEFSESLEALYSLEFEESGMILKQVLEESYTDGIDGFENVENDGTKITGIFLDRVSSGLTKRYQFEVTEDKVSYKLLNPDDLAKTNFSELSFAATASAAKKRNCVKGTACGSTCINKDRECGNKTTPASRGKVADLLTKAPKAEKVVKPKAEKVVKPKAEKKITTNTSKKPTTDEVQTKEDSKIKEKLSILDKGINAYKESNNPAGGLDRLVIAKKLIENGKPISMELFGAEPIETLAFEANKGKGNSISKAADVALESLWDLYPEAEKEKIAKGMRRKEDVALSTLQTKEGSVVYKIAKDIEARKKAQKEIEDADLEEDPFGDLDELVQPKKDNISDIFKPSKPKGNDFVRDTLSKTRKDIDDQIEATNKRLERNPVGKAALREKKRLEDIKKSLDALESVKEIRSIPETLNNFSINSTEAKEYEGRLNMLQDSRRTTALERVTPELQEAYPNLNKSELAAVKVYAQTSFDHMNTYLRSNKDEDAIFSIDIMKGSGEFRDKQTLKDDTVADVRATVSALNKLPNYEGVVFRGTRLPKNVSLSDIETMYKPGSTIEDKGFTSTSASDSSNFRGELQYEIKSKTGKDISGISDIPQEKEVLFRPNTKFKVIGLEKTNTGYKIKMEEE